MLIDTLQSEFERAFKKAISLEPTTPKKGTYISSSDRSRSEYLWKSLKNFCPPVLAGLEMEFIGNVQLMSLESAVDLCVDGKSDILICERNLGIENTESPYGLSQYLDAFIYGTDIPVLLLPADYPSQIEELPPARKIAVETDDIVGNLSLVNWALSFTRNLESVFLMYHLEDRPTFNYYLEIIKTFPGIDTTVFEEELPDAILKRAKSFIDNVKHQIEKAGYNCRVESIVDFGQGFSTHLAMLGSSKPDLVVMKARDKGHAGMHGDSYRLAISLKETAILLI